VVEAAGDGSGLLLRRGEKIVRPAPQAEVADEEEEEQEEEAMDDGQARKLKAAGFDAAGSDDDNGDGAEFY